MSQQEFTNALLNIFGSSEVGTENVTVDGVSFAGLKIPIGDKLIESVRDERVSRKKMTLIWKVKRRRRYSWRSVGPP